VEQRICVELVELKFEIQLLIQAMHSAAILETAAEDEARLASREPALVAGVVADHFEEKGRVWRERQVEARLKLQIYRRHRELLSETLKHCKAALERIEQRLLWKMACSETRSLPAEHISGKVGINQ
jgi:hypothetical protein